MDEREKAHEASSLDRRFHCTLLLGGQPGALAGQNATMRIDELFQEVDILVVDVLNIILGKNVVRHTI